MSITYYLKIDGISGDSLSKLHAGWFELDYFSLGQSSPAGMFDQLSAGSTDFGDLFVTLRDNTMLRAALAEMTDGQLISALEIEGVNELGQVVYDLSFNDLLIGLVQSAATAGEDPYTTLAFDYGKIGLVTYEQKADGTLAVSEEFGWDVTANEAIDPDSLVNAATSGTDAAGIPTTYFLKIDGIAGDSTSKGHEGWFELPSSLFGVTSATNIGPTGPVAGKLNFSDLNFYLTDNTALTALLANVASGKQITALAVEGVNANGQTVYDLTANDVFVTSVQQSSAEGGNAGLAVSFAFGKVGLTTAAVNGDGSLGVSESVAWDVTANTAIDVTSLVEPGGGSAPGVPDPVTYFLKISGISGDSVSKGHEGWFEIPAFSFGASNVYSLQGGLSAGRVSLSDLSVFLSDNTALAKLLMDNASGQVLQALEIEGVSSGATGSKVVYDLMLNNVTVSSVVYSGSTGDASISASFNFSKIGLVTTSLNSDGTIAGTQQFGWDLAENKAIGGTLLAPVAGTTDPVVDPVVYYLKIDGIAGDSLSKGHEGWFEIPAFSLGQSNSTIVSPGGGTTAGETNFSDLTVALDNNTALAALLAADVTGKIINAIEIEGVSASGRTVYDLTLNQVLVKGINNTNSAGSDSVSHVTFDFGKIGIVTTGQNPDGSAGDVQSFGWDLTTDAALDPVNLVTPSAGTVVEVTQPTQYFLKISGIAGDSTSKGHEGWFELPAFNFSAYNGGPIGSGSSAGVADFSDLVLSLNDNTALSPLLAYLATGKLLPALEIEGVATAGDGSQHVVYDLTLNTVLVNTIGHSDSEGSGAPTTTYSFDFGQIGLVTTSLRPDGTTAAQQSFGYDLTTVSTIGPGSLDVPTSSAIGAVGTPSVYYLKIDGVVGNSVSKGHEGWFEVSSFSLAAMNPTSITVQGLSAGQPAFADLNVLLYGTVGLSTLMGNSASGTAIRALEIEGVNAAGQTVYDLTLNQVFVTSILQGAGSGLDQPITTYSFAYEKIGLVNTVVNPNGTLGTSLKFGWDLATNKAIDPGSLATPGDTPPSVSITAQTLDADTGASDADRVTSDGHVILTGLAGDDGSVVSVHVFDGATDLGAATLNGGTWTFSTLLGEGSHALKAVATDNSGTSTTTAVQPTIVVDQTAPDAAIAAQVLGQDTGASASDGITQLGGVTLSGTASDGVGLSSVHIFDGATDLGEATLALGGWTFATELGEGSHQLKAVATDTAGNVTTTALQAPIVVDRTGPSVAITSQVLTNDTGLSSSDLVTSDGRVTLTGTVDDDVAIGSVRVFDGATDLGEATITGGTWTFSTTLAVGTHALNAVATDAAGNSAGTAAQPAISVVQYDPIVGQPGQTTMTGTSHADEIYFSTTNAVVYAGGGNDIISVTADTTFGIHYLDGGAGSDTLDLSRLTSGNTVNLATNLATGSQLGVALLSGIENVIGGSANDIFTASDARNTFTGGGGSDRFVFATLDAARNGLSYVRGNGDVITDFLSAQDGAGALRDIIDLSGIDAIQGKKDDAFTFIATPWDGTGNQFTAAGQLRVQYVVDAQGQEHTLLSGNVNPVGQGNGLAADFTIDLLGHHLLSAQDFVL